MVESEKQTVQPLRVNWRSGNERREVIKQIIKLQEELIRDVGESMRGLPEPVAIEITGKSTGSGVRFEVFFCELLGISREEFRREVTAR
ncbi:MAG: hypothetical protein WC641_04810 [Patescibacteria group bacterium]